MGKRGTGGLTFWVEARWKQDQETRDQEEARGLSEERNGRRNAVDENDVDHAEDTTCLKWARPREPGVTGFAFDLVPRTQCHELCHELRSWCLFMQKRLRMSENPGGARELDVEFRRRQKERERERGGGWEKVTVACRRVLNRVGSGLPLWPVAPANGKSPSRLSSGPSSFFLSFLLARLLLRCVVPFPSSSTTATLPRAFRERYRFPRESHSVDSKREDGNEDG